MSEDTFTIWWIDDETDREENHAKPLEEFRDSLRVVFTEPEDAESFLYEDKSIDELEVDGDRSIDLALIDWRLNQHGEFPGKGLTMAGSVREQLADVPIYGFTGGSTKDIQDLQNPSTDNHFQATYELKEIAREEGARLLEKDLRNYQQVKAARGEDFEALTETLSPPDGTLDELESVIPREFAQGLEQNRATEEGDHLRFVSWVRARFLETPGPLWDDMWTAVKVGIEPEIFDEYADQLVEAGSDDILYDGIFSHRCDRRWWSAEVIDAVVSLAEEDDKRIREINRDAAALLGVGDDRATCSACGEPYPDTVAAVIEREDATEPVHYQCSHVHHTREGAFEDFRVADGI